MKITFQLEINDKLASQLLEASQLPPGEQKRLQDQLINTTISRMGMKLEKKIKEQFLKILTKGERGITIVVNKK
jgi:hypothetical protein